MVSQMEVLLKGKSCRGAKLEWPFVFVQVKDRVAV